ISSSRNGSSVLGARRPPPLVRRALGSVDVGVSGGGRKERVVRVLERVVVHDSIVGRQAEVLVGFREIVRDSYRIL
ncbi:hypothetical protein PENTCL1PPCAC_18802, partial [Pristionchus entomophagus]